MAADTIIVTELVRKYADDLPGLDALRDKVLEAYTSRQSTLIHINQRGRDASTSAGINLATREDQASFLEACQEAQRQISGTTTRPASDIPPIMTYGMGFVQA
jgi:hypothetical protein